MDFQSCPPRMRRDFQNRKNRVVNIIRTREEGSGTGAATATFTVTWPPSAVYTSSRPCVLPSILSSRRLLAPVGSLVGKIGRPVCGFKRPTEKPSGNELEAGALVLAWSRNE